MNSFHTLISAKIPARESWHETMTRLYYVGVDCLLLQIKIERVFVGVVVKQDKMGMKLFDGKARKVYYITPSLNGQWIINL